MPELSRFRGLHSCLGGSRSRYTYGEQRLPVPVRIRWPSHPEPVDADAFVDKVRDGVGRFRWARVAGTVRPSTVGVANVLGEHCARVPLAHDQYAVGELGSQGADEAFAKTVHLRATKRNPDGTVALRRRTSSPCPHVGRRTPQEPGKP
jgi:hypothetical protein